MRKVTLKQIEALALDAKYRLWYLARQNGRDVKLYLHWTVGHYNQFFDDYHINIAGDGSYHIATEDFAQVLAHTWRRNSGSVGISLCCAVGATSSGLGSEPPTEAQIESMARVIAVLADALDLTIDVERVMTHGEAADNEDGIYPHDAYGPKTTCEKWDLEYLGTSESPRYNPWATDGSRGGDVLRGKAAWYRKEYPDGVERHFA